MGEFFAWIIGWDLILEYALGASTVAVGWSGYMVSLLRDFGWQFPPELMAATGTTMVNVPGEGWQPLTEELVETLIDNYINPATLPYALAWFDFPAVFIVLLLTGLLVVGITESAGSTTPLCSSRWAC